MTDEDAGRYLLPAVEDRRPELLSDRDISPLSQLPGDSTVSRADLQRDETVRRWGS